MEDLIDVLNKEEEQYQGLIELGKKKREVVIRADIKTLDEITAPGNKYFQYHTTFTSMKETFGYKTPEAWFAYLREWKEELAHPVTIKVIR